MHTRCASIDAVLARATTAVTSAQKQNWLMKHLRILILLARHTRLCTVVRMQNLSPILFIILNNVILCLQASLLQTMDLQLFTE